MVEQQPSKLMTSGSIPSPAPKFQDFARRALTGIAVALVLAFLPGTAQAQLRGHGGPVRALAVSPDGATAVSGSFDTSAIRWSLARNAAEQVLRFHESAVNAVALLPDGRIVTGGEDGRIAIWRPGAAAA